MQKICLLSLLFLSGCIDFKGAVDPYAYAPTRASLVWAPKTSPKRLHCPPEDIESIENEEPLTLGEVIDITLARNPETMESWAIARERAAEYGQSLRRDFVQAHWGAFYDRSRSAQFTTANRAIIHERLHGVDLNLNYLIFDFGQTRWSSRAALEALYDADWMHNRSIQITMQRVMDDYYNLLYQKEQLKANEQDVINAQVTLDAVVAKLEQGMADMGEQVQAKTQLLEQLLNVVRQKRRLHNSYTKLLTQMGVSATNQLAFEEYPQIVEVPHADDLQLLITSAIDNRPDLLAAEADIKSQRAHISAAIAKKFPKIDADFDIGRTYYQKGLNDEYDYRFEVRLRMPLFEGFFIKNTINLARSRLEQARAQLAQKKLAIMEQVSNSQNNVLLAREALQYAEEFLASAEEEFRINLEKYKVGTGTIVELIDGQTAVADAQARLALAKRDWYTSLANLASATGILYPEGAFPCAQ